MTDTGGTIAIPAGTRHVSDTATSLKSRAARIAAVAMHGPRSTGRVAQVIRFGWHFGQMCLAMLIGMIPFGIALTAVGHPNLDTQSPEVYALAMTLSMLLPMVGWMRVLGHGWERTAEMSAAMSVPVAIAAAGSLIGPFPHSAAVSAMNSAMWLGMLGAMLLRWREYAQGCHGHANPAES